jgi:hypothetical protein
MGPGPLCLSRCLPELSDPHPSLGSHPLALASSTERRGPVLWWLPELAEQACSGDHHWSSRFSTRVTLSPGDIWQWQEIFLVVKTGLRMVLNSLQGTGWSPQ